MSTNNSIGKSPRESCRPSFQAEGGPARARGAIRRLFSKGRGWEPFQARMQKIANAFGNMAASQKTLQGKRARALAAMVLRCLKSACALPFRLAETTLRVFSSILGGAPASPGGQKPTEVARASDAQKLPQARCRALLDADAAAQLFGRFGIHCPEGDEATPEHTKAMIARVETILQSMTEVLRCYPGPSFQGCTAEALVMERPPERLQHVLETAYRCNLCKLFASYAKLPTSTLSLDDACGRIGSWLRTPEAGGVVELAARGAGLTCIPSEVCALKGLKKLLLPGNALATLPPEVAELKELEVLSLVQNQFEELPSAISTLTELKALALFRNRLFSLPRWLGGLPHLTTLLVGCNQLSAIPSELGNVTSLRHLDLHGNNIRKLPDEIQNCKALEYLDVTQNPLECQFRPNLTR